MIVKTETQYAPLSLLIVSIAALFLATAPAAAKSFTHDCAQATQWQEPLSSTRFVRLAPGEDANSHFAQLLDYVCSGDYLRDITGMIDKARAKIAARVKSDPAATNLAVVLDIDETSLSNMPQILMGDFRDPTSGPEDSCAVPSEGCGYTTWDRMAKDEAIAPTLQLYREAIASGVAVFFITGRPEEKPVLDATQTNLRQAGYGGYKCLFLRPQGMGPKPVADKTCTEISAALAMSYPHTADFKRAVRDAIRDAHYDIIANIGDQDGDLSGPGKGNEPAEATFLLPNPFYQG